MRYDGSMPGVAAPARRDTDARRTLGDGLIAGLFGYASLAIFFAVIGVLRGDSVFHIAGLLAAVLFRTAVPEGGTVDVGAIATYTALHLLVLMCAGLLMAALARLAARALQGWYMALIAIVFGLIHVLAVPIWFDARVAADLSVGLVMAGTTLATGVMVAYLWAASPEIRTAMHEPDE
ncbi:MAG TPA: hypothetical protein VK928_04860 [Longimicrobiales bacterium]|nr:hypothetical protein [Longimicrobiales bacterium]